MVSRLNRKFRRGRKHLWNSEREGGVKESGIPNAWGGGGGAFWNFRMHGEVKFQCHPW